MSRFVPECLAFCTYPTKSGPAPSPSSSTNPRSICSLVSHCLMGPHISSSQLLFPTHLASSNPAPFVRHPSRFPADRLTSDRLGRIHVRHFISYLYNTITGSASRLPPACFGAVSHEVSHSPNALTPTHRHHVREMLWTLAAFICLRKNKIPYRATSPLPQKAAGFAGGTLADAHTIGIDPRGPPVPPRTRPEF
jgi:hypothetical protein